MLEAKAGEALSGGGGAGRENGEDSYQGGMEERGEESICTVTFSDPISLMNPNEGFNKITVYNLCLHQSVHRSATLPISSHKHARPSHTHLAVTGPELGETMVHWFTWSFYQAREH